jgi:hypothetical protein
MRARVRLPGAAAGRRRAAALVLVAALCAAAGVLPAAASDAPYLTIRAEDNELTVRRRAPAMAVSLERFATDLERPLPPTAAALRLLRASPPEMIEYVLNVTADGVLVVGHQIRTLDFPSGRYVFARSGITRSYPPLEGASWRWLLELPVSRERRVTLDVRLEPPAWPAETVSIRVAGSP